MKATLNIAKLSNQTWCCFHPYITLPQPSCAKTQHILARSLTLGAEHPLEPQTSRLLILKSDESHLYKSIPRRPCVFLTGKPSRSVVQPCIYSLSRLCCPWTLTLGIELSGLNQPTSSVSSTRLSTLQTRCRRTLSYIYIASKFEKTRAEIVNRRL